MGPARLKGDDGFTLVELLVAFTILIIGLTGTFALVEAANGRSTVTKGREGATNVAREISEQVRILPYTRLVAASLQPDLQAQPGLADASPAGGWQIERRGFIYTVGVSVCMVDDRADRFGDKSTGGFCPDSNQPSTGDPQPDDLKRVTVEVSFQDRNRTVQTRSVSTINSVLQTTGVAVTALSLNRTVPTGGMMPPPSTPTQPTIGTAVDQLVFRAKANDLAGCATTTSPAGCKIIWSVQGQLRQPEAVRLSPTGDEWEFTWTITGLSDGVYFVGAQAVEKNGDIGPIREIPVRLARSAPPAPTELQGGFNTIERTGAATRVAELQWTASPRLDVKGYRVVRTAAPTVTVCETAGINETSCIDFNAPEETASPDDREYEVRAIYYSSAGVKSYSAPAEITLEPIGGTRTDTTVTPVNRSYRLQGTQNNIGTACFNSTDERDMRNGADGIGGSFTGGGNRSIAFCSPAFGTGEGIPAGPVTFNLRFESSAASGDRTCYPTATLTRQGSAATTLSTSAPLAVPPGTWGDRAFTMPNVPATSLAPGDRLNLRVTFDHATCSKVQVVYGLTGGYNFGRLGLQTSVTTSVLVNTTTRPNPPTNLTATPQGDGTVLLRWNKPASGPAVDFYRIYKDGRDYTKRLNTTGEGILASEEYTVPGGAATYHVSAVAPTMTESTFAGPVSP